jgi:hypothetical protein
MVGIEIDDKEREPGLISAAFLGEISVDLFSVKKSNKDYFIAIQLNADPKVPDSNSKIAPAAMHFLDRNHVI